eukprot:gene4487-7868_t
MRIATLPILIVVAHYGYLYVRNNRNYKEANILSMLYLAYYETIFWTTSVVFHFMDKYMKNHPNKIQSKNETNLDILDAIPTILLNHFVQFFVWSFMFQVSLRNDYSDSLILTFIWFLAIYVAFAAVFYFGHYAEHKLQFLKTTHVLHHETFATKAFTGHYMTLIDFFFQSIFGGCAGIALCFLGCSPMAVLAFVSYGIFNTVVTHSGWDFEYLPDPKIHMAHHSKYFVNYGCGIFDEIFNTKGISE